MAEFQIQLFHGCGKIEQKKERKKEKRKNKLHRNANFIFVILFI